MRLVVVPADGSCFFHATAIATDGAFQHEHLRRIAGTPPNEWASEDHINALADALKIRYRFLPVCLDGEEVVVDLDAAWHVGPTVSCNYTCTLVYWLTLGGGLHFDLVQLPCMPSRDESRRCNNLHRPAPSSELRIKDPTNMSSSTCTHHTNAVPPLKTPATSVAALSASRQSAWSRLRGTMTVF